MEDMGAPPGHGGPLGVASGSTALGRDTFPGWGRSKSRHLEKPGAPRSTDENGHLVGGRRSPGKGTARAVVAGNALHGFQGPWATNEILIRESLHQ